MDNESFKYYLLDFGDHLKTYALEEVKENRFALTKESKAYCDGLKAAYRHILSLMQEEAKLFDIPLNELKLHDIDPEKDLA